MFKRVIIIITLTLILGLYITATAEEATADIKLAERGNKADTEVKENRIVTLEYANILLKDGREQENPMMLGLAAVTYFATKIDPEYATRILEEATKLARDNNDWNSLKWLADVWGDKVLGPGDLQKSEKYMKEAETLAGIKLRGTKSQKESTLVPDDYLNK
ncbi:hypothetical protein JXI42_12945 [bacterium]|nr:hypothetical protein [bacterium]